MKESQLGGKKGHAHIPGPPPGRETRKKNPQIVITFFSFSNIK